MNREREIEDLVQNDTYEIVVRFSQPNLTNDIHIVQTDSRYDGLPLAEALAKLFTYRLQFAYNSPLSKLAGRFDVISGPTLDLRRG